MKNANAQTKEKEISFYSKKITKMPFNSLAKNISYSPNHKIENAGVKNPNTMGQPLNLNSINPLLMRFLSSVKIWEQSQTI